MSLGDVLHQGFAQRLIQRAMSSDRIPHAYIFHGPVGVGKESLAMGLAELLLCDAPVDQEFAADGKDSVGVDQMRVGCGRCEDCRSFAARTHPDLHLIYRQLGKQHPDPAVRKRQAKELGVDVVRHFIIRQVGLTPARGRAKVFVIREADRMTAAAQNALLKTLEEPPGATVLILLAASADRLLPTTLSRCQSVRFDGLPTSFVEERLARLKPDIAPDRLQWYARYGDGSIGRAVESAEDDLFDMNERLLGRLSGMTGRSNASTSSELVKSLTDEAKSLGDVYRKRDADMTPTEASRQGLKQLFRLTSAWYADLLRIASGEHQTVVNTPWASKMETAAEMIGPRPWIDSIHRIARAEHQLDLNANVQLCVETLVHDLTRMARRGDNLPVT